MKTIRTTTILTFIAILCALASTTRAADLNVVVHTIASDPVAGQLLGFNLTEGAVVRVGADTRRIPADEVISIDVNRTERSADDSPDAAAQMGRGEVIVDLARGDRIIGRITEGRSEHFVIHSDTFGHLRVALESCARITWFAGRRPAQRGIVQRFLQAPGTSDDAVLTANGDIVRGFITALDQEGVSVDVRGDERKVPDKVLLACRFAQTQPAVAERLRASLHFVGGEQITAVGVDWMDDHVELRTADDERVRFDTSHLARIDIAGGRWKWLSEIQPAKADSQGLMGVSWRARYDRNVRGGALQVAGQSYERGIGVHSKSQLIYLLGGSYRELVVGFGIDDDSGPLADVDVSVLVDGVEKLNRTGVRAGTHHGAFRIDLRTARALELSVDYGANGDLQDRFDWLAPGLVRAAE